MEFFPNISRREFCKITCKLSAASVLLYASNPFALLRSSDLSSIQNNKEAYKIFTKKYQAKLIYHIADRFIPSQTVSGGPKGAKDVDIVGRLDRFVYNEMTQESKDSLKTFLLLFNIATLGRFDKMSDEDKDKVLAELANGNSNLQQNIFKRIKRLIMSAFWGTKDGWEVLNYGGPQNTPPTIGKYTYDN